MPRRLIYGLVLCAFAASYPLASIAATDVEIKLIHDTVRSQYASFDDYCKQTDQAKRQLVLQTTMKLVSDKKLADPYSAGPAAGALLRKACGADDAQMTVQQTRWLVTSKPLVFESEQKTLGMFTTASGMVNQIYVPENYKQSDGLLPAVVLNHTIGGVSTHLKVQAKSLLDAGYAVMVVDSYSPRNLRSGSIALPPSDMAKDAYDALAHLRAQSYIDKERIFQSGYSLGAYAAALLASPEGATALKSQGRFRATVAHYGSCALSDSKVDMLSADTDRPILLLMGELDVESPAKNCFPRLNEMKIAGKPVQWHVYPNTTHGWDKAENNGYIYRAASGETMTYRYDATVTQDATNRMIAFFNSFR
jgi:dienelactone hydrolase